MIGRDEPNTEDVFARVELAGVYINDGAPRSAARCLREAAAMLEALAQRQGDALEKFLNERRP